VIVEESEKFLIMVILIRRSAEFKALIHLILATCIVSLPINQMMHTSSLREFIPGSDRLMAMLRERMSIAQDREDLAIEKRPLKSQQGLTAIVASEMIDPDGGHALPPSYFVNAGVWRMSRKNMNPLITVESYKQNKT